jgi:hypothetical protein
LNVADGLISDGLSGRFKKSRLTAEAFTKKSGDSKFKEPFVDISAALKPSAKMAQTMEPCIGALDDPAHCAKTASVRFAASGNRCGDAGNVQRAVIFVAVVSGGGQDSNRHTHRSTS